MRRRAALAAVVGGLLVVACARTDTLGAEEAVEVLVLDGMSRDRAACMVLALDGELALEKITGLDTDLTDDELDLLSVAGAGCAPVFGTGGGVIGGDDTAQGFDPIAALADPQHHDPSAGVDELVDGLVLGGMDPGIGACLVERILAAPDPAAIVASDEQLSSLILDCRRAEDS